MGKGKQGGRQSKTVGVSTVLQTTSYDGPHGAWVPEEHEDA